MAFQKYLLKKMMRNLFFIGVFLFLMGCANPPKNSLSIGKKGWEIDQPCTLNFTVKDTLTKKDLMIHIQHDENYPFENIFIITHLTAPKGMKIIDTLEYNLCDTNGKWLGSGWGHEKNIQLYYKENIPLKKGHYRLKIWQAMRKRNEINGVRFLKGIRSVGIQLENR